MALVRGRWMAATLVVAASAAAAGTGLARQDDPARQGLTVLRALNSLQSEAHRGSRTYITLDDILQHGDFTRIFKSTRVDADTAAIGGQRLTLVRSADGTRYQAMIVSDDRCGPAHFTSEQGVIYAGRPIGCDP